IKSPRGRKKGICSFAIPVLEPGESSPWHTDSCHRITVILSGDRLAIEFRESGEVRQFDVQAGQVDWDKPTTEVHRAINVGRARYEEIVVFFLSEPGQMSIVNVHSPCHATVSLICSCSNAD